MSKFKVGDRVKFKARGTTGVVSVIENDNWYAVKYDTPRVTRDAKGKDHVSHTCYCTEDAIELYDPVKDAATKKEWSDIWNFGSDDD